MSASNQNGSLGAMASSFLEVNSMIDIRYLQNVICLSEMGFRARFFVDSMYGEYLPKSDFLRLRK